jgi:hypothetical protein
LLPRRAVRIGDLLRIGSNPVKKRELHLAPKPDVE